MGVLSIHPIGQAAAVVLGCYVFSLGVRRFQSLHLGQSVRFDRKRHILLGKITLIAWFAGMAGGAAVVRTFWYGLFITGAHADTAKLILPFLFTGFFTGLYLERRPGRRKVLPAIHGIANVITLLLALYQVYTGWGVYNAFVLGN